MWQTAARVRRRDGYKDNIEAGSSPCRSALGRELFRWLKQRKARARVRSCKGVELAGAQLDKCSIAATLPSRSDSRRSRARRLLRSGASSTLTQIGRAHVGTP